MPLIRPGMRRPPHGFDVIQAKLEEYEEEMKLATQEESRGVVGQTTRPRPKDAAAVGHKRPRASDSQDTLPVNVEGEKCGQEEHDGNGERTGDISVSSTWGTSADNSKSNISAPAVPPLWRMAAINRERTRYVFTAYSKHRSISKEVYDYCVEMQLIDGGLARRWRLPGYERLCCTACGVPGAASLASSITTKYALRDRQERRLPNSSAANNSGKVSEEEATCICRVPASQRKNKYFVACAVCGCTGCCSADVPPSAQEKLATSL